MDEDVAASLSVICRDYRAMFIPPSLSVDWADTERANRGFIAVGLAGDNALFHGPQRILEHLDALCRACSVHEVVTLTKSPLLDDLAPRALGLVAPDGETELVPHLRWLLAIVNGKGGDATLLWRDKQPQEAFESLSRLYKSDLPAYVLVREAIGVRSHANISPDALAAATRLGVVSWTESVLDERGGFEALHRVLDQYDDGSAWEALEWFARVQCSTTSQRCITCALNMTCEALALGAL